MSILQRRLVRVAAAPTLALCAGLWIAMWTGAANAVVDSITNLVDVRFGSMAGDADLAGTASMTADVNSKTVAGGVFDLGGSALRGKFKCGVPMAVDQ